MVNKETQSRNNEIYSTCFQRLTHEQFWDKLKPQSITRLRPKNRILKRGLKDSLPEMSTGQKWELIRKNYFPSRLKLSKEILEYQLSDSMVIHEYRNYLKQQEDSNRNFHSSESEYLDLRNGDVFTKVYFSKPVFSKDKEVCFVSILVRKHLNFRWWWMAKLRKENGKWIVEQLKGYHSYIRWFC